MGQLSDRMATDLLLAGYSPVTAKIYLYYAYKFAKHFMRSPTEMGEDEVREFLVHLIAKQHVSCETLRQVRAALKVLYSITLRRPMEVEHLPIQRRQKRLPAILSGTEVESIFAAVLNDMYRAILMTMYGGGLRIFEACQLRPEHIDSKRMLIRVEFGKGARDRDTLLPKRLLTELRAYWTKHRPSGGWMFPGRSAKGYVCPETVRGVLKKAVASTAIKKRITPHTLRHSFATHLLEIGNDVTVVKALLGHGSLKATEVYVHLSVDHLARTRSPLDLLGSPSGTVLG